LASPTTSLSDSRPGLEAENRVVLVMKSGVSAEELAKIAGVKATTVRQIAHELLELLEHDLEAHGVAVKEANGS